jgi:hypothetical protein
MHYQTFRSVSDGHVFVLCYEGTFYDSVPNYHETPRPVAGKPPRRRRGVEA